MREKGKCGVFVDYNLYDQLSCPNPVAAREKEVLQIRFLTKKIGSFYLMQVNMFYFNLCVIIINK